MAKLFIVQQPVTESDPYTVLGLGRTATEADIRTAYRALATLYHPDRHQGNPLAALAGEKLTEINRAYEALATPAHRRVFYGGTGGPAPAGPVSRATRAYLATVEQEVAAPVEQAPRRYGMIIALVVLLPLVVRFGDVIARTVRSFIVDVLGGLALVQDSTVAAMLATLGLTLALLLRVRRAAAEKHHQPIS